MIVTIHQPEHFPYMGYFQKMKNSDIFVVLDDVKFKKIIGKIETNIFLNKGMKSGLEFPFLKKAMEC